jgi:hypothetical protein
MGSKCLAWSGCHMCKKTFCPKTVWLSIEIHFWNFWNFWEFLHCWLWTKIFIHNYVWMWKLTIATWIILNWTIQFFSLKFVSNKCYLQKNSPIKVLKSFFLFLGTPTMNKPICELCMLWNIHSFGKLNYRNQYHYIYSNSNIKVLVIIKDLDHIATQKVESGTFNNLLGHFNNMGAVH